MADIIEQIAQKLPFLDCSIKNVMYGEIKFCIINGVIDRVEITQNIKIKG